MQVNIQDALKDVMQRHGKGCSLEVFQKVLHLVNDPQNKLSVVQIVGTNGKGSTAWYLSSLLQANGLKVGLFTSPHLESHLDRIRINGTWMEEEVFLSYYNTYYDLIETYQLNMFEIDVLFALLYFAQNKVDICILEAGIGGLLDTTNCTKWHELCIITTIDYDHMQYLGSSIQDIAYQKAGIIKDNDLVLIGPLEESAKEVIEKQCRLHRARLVSVQPFEKIKPHTFLYKDDVYTIASDATYQIQNAAVAIEAYELLGYKIHTKKCKDALAKSFWKGRFETVHKKPRVIVDGAHNMQAIHVLAKELKNVARPISLVFVAMKDKEPIKEVEVFEPIVDEIIVSQLKNERSFKEMYYKKEYIHCKDFEQALQKAMDHRKHDGTVVVCGSLYAVSKTIEILNK